MKIWLLQLIKNNMANYTDKNLINQAVLMAIERRIDLYEHGQLSLPQLAQELFSTVGGMIEVSTDWYNRFMKYWGAIEEVNALALSEGLREPKPEHEEVLYKALDEVRKLVRQGL